VIGSPDVERLALMVDAATSAAEVERLRCVDELLAAAGERMRSAASSQFSRLVAHMALRDSSAFYWAAWLIALPLGSSECWPSPLEWEEWARDACGLDVEVLP
jgi:hypothetical protein